MGEFQSTTPPPPQQVAIWGPVPAESQLEGGGIPMHIDIHISTAFPPQKRNLLFLLSQKSAVPSNNCLIVEDTSNKCSWSSRTALHFTVTINLKKADLKKNDPKDSRSSFFCSWDIYPEMHTHARVHKHSTRTRARNAHTQFAQKHELICMLLCFGGKFRGWAKGVSPPAAR